MIDWDKLNLFIHEELNYKDDVSIVYYRQLASFIDIKLSCPNNLHEMSEVVDISRYNNWIKKFDRDEKIYRIIN